MTQTEKNNRIYSLKCSIEDRFKSVQGYANSLKSPDDDQKNLLSIAKMKDCFTDIIRYYGEIEDIENEAVTDEESDPCSGYYNPFF